VYTKAEHQFMTIVISFVLVNHFFSIIPISILCSQLCNESEELLYETCFIWICVLQLDCCNVFTHRLLNPRTSRDNLGVRGCRSTEEDEQLLSKKLIKIK